jgi:hypothetical protein
MEMCPVEAKFRRCDVRSGGKKSGYFHLFYAAARIIPIQRLTIKNPRNPENLDSKPSYRIKPDYPKG